MSLYTHVEEGAELTPFKCILHPRARDRNTDFSTISHVHVQRSSIKRVNRSIDVPEENACIYLY